MPSQAKKHETQWAAQFYAAAELTRRGYLVSLTFGNAPVADLMVRSPEGRMFTVDVKGQASKNFWLVQPRKPNPDHFFIMVYVSAAPAAPRYCVLSSDALMGLREAYATRITPGGKYHDAVGGVNWSTPFEHEGRWESLPQ